MKKVIVYMLLVVLGIGVYNLRKPSPLKEQSNRDVLVEFEKATDAAGTNHVQRECDSIRMLLYQSDSTTYTHKEFMRLYYKADSLDKLRKAVGLRIRDSLLTTLSK